MTYRRRKSSDTWHFIRECSWWPRRVGENQVGDNRPFWYTRDEIVERFEKPTTGEKCDECQAKERAS